MLHSAPVAPIRGVFLSYSPRCLGSSSPWHRVHPRTIQSGGLRCASFLPGCSNPGGPFVIFSPLPQTLQSGAPGSPPDDPVRGFAPCFNPPRLLQSGGSFCRTLSAASDAPVRGTGFTPGRSSPGANVVLHSTPVAPIRGVFLSYSPRCLGRSSQWHRVHPRAIQSGAWAVLIEEILSVYDPKGRAWGLDINLSKTELHSMGKTPQTTITAPSGRKLSTIDPKTLAPRKVYKYLGVHLFTDPDPTLTYELAKSEITSFFTFLHPLNLTLSQYI